MSGIKEIAGRREQEKSTQVQSGMELWLKDGDQAFVAFAATGEEDDHKLDDVYIHTLRSVGDSGADNFSTVICGKTFEEACELCKKDRPSHQFAIWSYVYYILHSKNEGDNEEWEEVETKTHQKVYKETIGDFRLFRRGFGQRDYLWEMLVGIYGDAGNLNTKITRISRKGSKMKDTSYMIVSTSSDVKLPKEAQEKLAELPGIKEFFRQKGQQEPEKGEEESVKPKILRKRTSKVVTEEEPEVGEGEEELDGGLF